MVQRRFLSLLRHSRFELLWALPVWILLGLARVLLKIVPFAKLAPWLGHPAELGMPLATLDPRQQALARLIGHTVQFVARHTPWQSTCFAQVIAARCLLQIYRIPYGIFFGLERGPDGLQAHAWLVAADISVTGGLGFDRYVVVGCFLGGAHPAIRT